MAILPTDALKDPSPQMQAVLRWADAYITTLDLKALESTLTDDYTHQVLPESMRQPVRDKSQFLEYADKFGMRILKDFKVCLSIRRRAQRF